MLPVAVQKTAQLKAFQASRKIDLSGDRETKTKKALEYFAEELQHEATTTSAG